MRKNIFLWIVYCFSCSPALTQNLKFETTTISVLIEPLFTNCMIVDSLRITIKNQGPIPLMFEAVNNRPFVLALMFPDSNISITTQTPFREYDDRGFTENLRINTITIKSSESKSFNIPLLNLFYYKPVQMTQAEYEHAKKEVNIGYILIKENGPIINIQYPLLFNFKNNIEVIKFFVGL